MSYTSYKKIIDHLDIDRSDSLFVSSDIKRLAFSCLQNDESFDGNLFIDSIIERLGPDGTLVFPTYNWDFCSGIPFDYYKTKSKAGALTNIALKRVDFKRTKHPIYSFAVWGRDKDILCGLDNESAFGDDSAFPMFCRNNYKHLFIDTLTATFAHYCEEKIGVPYRYLKRFAADYRDGNGDYESREYTMYVRRLDMKVSTRVDRMHEIFLERGAAVDSKINGILFRILDMPAACDLIEYDIVHNNCGNIAVYKAADNS